MVPLSILDLVRVTEETDARGALDNARDLASHTEDLAGDRFSCRLLRRSVGASVHVCDVESRARIVVRAKTPTASATYAQVTERAGACKV
jgi:hypothetical protein